MQRRKKRQSERAKFVARLGMLLALALLCSYVESLIPFSFGIPGIRLGLANLVVVVALYTLGTKEALMISVARILLSGFIFGNLTAIIYSMAGGLLSLFIMALLKKTLKLNVVSISAAGGIFHNIGQLLVAALVVETFQVLYYMTVLFFSGLVTGILIGVISQEILKRLGGKV